MVKLAPCPFALDSEPAPAFIVAFLQQSGANARQGGKRNKEVAAVGSPPLSGMRRFRIFHFIKRKLAKKCSKKNRILKPDCERLKMNSGLLAPRDRVWKGGAIREIYSPVPRGTA
jgi:hypothetical protein